MNDLTGQRFGRLVAIKATDKRIRNSIAWECKCDCGNIAVAGSSDLKGGKTRSCGCMRKEWSAKQGKLSKIDIAGQRFGMLTVLRPTETREHGAVIWECLCDCGNTTFVRPSNLKSGGTTSCGCRRKENATQRGRKTVRDLTGQRFGRLVVIRPTEERRSRAVVWECKCDCGGTVFTTGNDLKRGNTRSCGCGRYQKRG